MISRLISEIDYNGGSMSQAPKPKIRKTSISLPEVVMGWGKERMLEKGFGENFSNYLADLIRHDKEGSDSIKRHPINGSSQRKIKI
jgi:hypothetical protein